jgi:4-hydroxybenzoate polyprenyltransferase
MTLMIWVYMAALAVLAFSVGYRVGDVHGRRALGATLRRVGSSLADKL